MRKFATTLMSLLIIQFASTQGIAFTITGNVSGLDGKFVKLHVMNDKEQYSLLDSIEVRQGKFTFTGNIAQPVLAMVELNPSIRRNLFLANEQLQINGNIAEPSSIRVDGSELTNDYNQYDSKMIDPVRLKLVSIGNDLDKAEKNGEGSKLASLNQSLNKTFESIGDSTEKFIRQNPTSYVSLYLLNAYRKMYKTPLLKELFYSLDPKLQTAPAARSLAEALENYKGSTPGNKATTFTFTDISGKRVTLESLQNDYVFIVFWASWCVPCLQEMPQLKQAAASLVDKPFKIIMFSIDKDQSKWMAAVDKFKISSFIHSNLPNEFNDPIAVNFDVNAIPSNCLLTPGARIIRKNIPPGDIVSYLSTVVK